MENVIKKFQQNTLVRMQELNCNVEMQLSVWQPSREQIKYLLDLKEFIVHPYSKDAGIFSLISRNNVPGMSFAQTEIVVFCNRKDEKQVTEEIKKRKEVKTI